jgi:hypothetical protein
LLSGGYGFIDNSGKLAIRASDRVHNVREFSEGLAVIAVKPSRGQITDGASKWGYLDLAGNIVIQPEYERATDFSEGLAAVQLAGKWGYIDKFGKHVIDFDYYSAAEAFEMRFSDGLAAAMLLTPADRRFYGKYGYIERTGKFVIQPQFDAAFPFSDGMARISVDGRIGKRRYGFISRQGKMVIAPQYPAAGDFSEGIAFVQVRIGDREKVGYIDKAGKFVIPAQFDGVYEKVANAEDLQDLNFYKLNGKERDFSEGYAAVRIGENWGYINREGKIVIQPQYHYAGRFREGLAPVAVRRGKKRIYGFIDTSGRLVIPLQYDNVGEFNGEVAPVFVLDSQGEIDKLGYINKAAKFIWGPTK